MTTTEYQRGQSLGAPTVEIACCHCGIRFAVPDEFERVRRLDHANFHCPLGHSQHFAEGKTQLQAAREERERAELALQRERQSHDQTRADRDHKEMQRRAEKGKVTRLKNRAAAGVCPCCNRTFQNLARHMKSKHPSFTDTE